MPYARFRREPVVFTRHSPLFFLFSPFCRNSPARRNMQTGCRLAILWDYGRHFQNVRSALKSRASKTSISTTRFLIRSGCRSSTFGGLLWVSITNQARTRLDVALLHRTGSGSYCMTHSRASWGWRFWPAMRWRTQENVASSFYLSLILLERST